DELDFGEFKMSVVHTPGHTPGSVCLVIANHAFVGDTILAGGIGRQMPETDLRRQMMSIGTRLLRLPLSTAIYPGPGPAQRLERAHRLRAEGRGLLRVDHHQVRVVARRDASLALAQSSQSRGALADPPRREPRVAHVPRKLEAAEVERLHARRARRRVLQVLR